MKRFTISTDISSPPTRVWEVMSDVDRWHEWTRSVSSARRLGDRPFAVGTTVMLRQPKFPPALWKVSEVVPGERFTWIAAAPGFRAVGIHSIEPTSTGSRATLTLEYHGPFAGIFARMTKDITEQYIGFEAAGLKARSENPSFRAGGA